MCCVYSKLYLDYKPIPHDKKYNFMFLYRPIGNSGLLNNSIQRSPMFLSQYLTDVLEICSIVTCLDLSIPMLDKGTEEVSNCISCARSSHLVVSLGQTHTLDI